MTNVAQKTKLVKSLPARLASMAKEKYDDREKITNKCKKELARRQDDYERHLKEVSISVQLLSSTVACFQTCP